MNTVVTTDPESPRSISQRERWEFQKHIVRQVAGAYEQLRYLPALAARAYDPTPESQSLTITPESIEFGADVENAIRYALRSQQDAEALKQAWDRLCMDTDVIDKIQERFIKRAAPICAARGLHPKKYFRRIRRKVGEKLSR